MLQGKKILGTVAYLGGVHAVAEPFCWSWGQMIQLNTEYFCSQGEIVHYDRATVSYHSFARNTIVERMRGDFLLMLDTDHSVPPDILIRLHNIMERCEIDVLSGLYQYKSAPYLPVLYWHNEVEEGYDAMVNWTPGLMVCEIKSAGAGCLLVRKSVYDRIRDELDEQPFDIIHPFSEDHSFFRRLERLNIKAYFAPEVECPHLEVREITMADYDRTNVELDETQKVGGIVNGN